MHPPKSTKITTKASQFEYVYARKNNIATRIDGLRCLNVCGQPLDHRKPPSFDYGIVLISLILFCEFDFGILLALRVLF